MLLLRIILLVAVAPFRSAAQSDIALPPMLTRWAAEVDRNQPWPEYPRPQLQRDTWINLNGPWDYAVQPRDVVSAPATFDGRILVPFAIGSHLSGVPRTVGAGERLWYRRTFPTPELPHGQRLLLHFGAVDWQADVFLNGRPLGRHEGGYDPFWFDVTDALIPEPVQELVVAVWDPTDTGGQPRGKQVQKAGGIWYAPVTGIWQTVWLEAVAAAPISGVRIAPDFDRGEVDFRFNLHRGRRGEVEIRVFADSEVVASIPSTAIQSALGDATRPITLKVSRPRAWSPEDPFLYDVEIVYRSGQSEDRVRSYFGFRKIEVRRAADGHHRLFMNNQAVFQFGALDQGWWPDGLYTAPSDAALRSDVEMMKQLGFNLSRKHVKVEPARWYYHCDRLGLLVWQDMPSMGKGGIGMNIVPEQAIDGMATPAEAGQFRRELLAMIENFRHFPSIVAWVPFNEGWGQHDTNETLAWVKKLDPSRLVGGPSGWNDLGFGDMYDKHYYEAATMWAPVPGRANVLGEFGALKHAVKGHLWWEDPVRPNPIEAPDAFAARYLESLRPLESFNRDGLAAAVYTQLTDVEGEINGLVTYDRAVTKIPAATLAAWHRAVIAGERLRKEER